MKINIVPELEGDSRNYEVLTEGIEKVADVEGLTCEIGLRRGGGTYHILEALRQTNQKKVHIAIDPYGNIEYPEGDAGNILRLDYTNTMRDECLAELYLYCKMYKSSLLFFNLEDTEFFARFAEGVPVYQQHKHLVNDYAFVHFDGPHTVQHVKVEVDFFDPRSPLGAVWVFDDVALYNHTEVDTYVKSLGWSCYRQTERKWAYVKETHTV